MRKPTNRTSYQEVTALYEKYGRADYQLQTVQDILNIHGYDITETTGYQDLTEENKRIFEAYVIRHLNNVGMNTRLTMWPKSVHYVRELTYTGPEEKRGRLARARIPAAYLEKKKAIEQSKTKELAAELRRRGLKVKIQ